MITDNNFKTNLQEDGFLILRNLLTEDEVAKLRKTLKTYFLHDGIKIFGGISQPNAAVLIPELDWVFSHPKIIDALKNLVENEKLMFTSHCDIHFV